MTPPLKTTKTSHFTISTGQKAALNTLAYFAVFQYPLKLEEIQAFSSTSVAEQELIQLVEFRLIDSKNGYYGFPDSLEQLERRLKGNKKSLELEGKAIQKSRFIGQFPFVRSVSVSGSMSKGYVDEESDIDFFIVTQPGRLWVARTFLVLYKKVFLFNSRKYFCVNYFVDTHHLEIEEKNRFTSTEVVTLRNMYGKEVFETFMAQNNWATQAHPTYRSNHVEAKDQSKWTKRTLEKIFGGGMGERLDSWCMKRTLKRWERKFGDMDRAQFDVAFKTRKYVSKHHPGNFQKQVLDRMQHYLRNLEEEHNIHLID